MSGKSKESDGESSPQGMNMGDGLMNVRAFSFLILWYLFSGCTLFLNKYILTSLHGDPTFLGKFAYRTLVILHSYLLVCHNTDFLYDFAGTCQMMMTLTCGFIQMYFPCGMYRQVTRYSRPPGFYRHMILVGTMR